MYENIERMLMQNLSWLAIYMIRICLPIACRLLKKKNKKIYVKIEAARLTRHTNTCNHMLAVETVCNDKT